MNILAHPIHQDIYDLCQEIEKLPASEQQTKVVVMASNLHTPVDKLLAVINEMRQPIGLDMNDRTWVKTYEELQEVIHHWLGDAADATAGKYGSNPKGYTRDYWVGRQSVLAELKTFLPPQKAFNPHTDTWGGA